MEYALSIKGQATIPKAIRNHLHLGLGDRIKFFLHPDGSVVILPKIATSKLKGIVKANRRVSLNALWSLPSLRVPSASGRAPNANDGSGTNVLVRCLSQDDAILSPLATQIIDRQLTEESPGFISLVTLVETVWVLARAYGLSNQEIAVAVERILQVDPLLVQNEQEAFTAMIALKTGAGSFADALIGALGAWAECAATLTFDKKAKRLKQFQILPS